MKRLLFMALIALLLPSFAFAEPAMPDPQIWHEVDNLAAKIMSKGYMQELEEHPERQGVVLVDCISQAMTELGYDLSDTMSLMKWSEKNHKRLWRDYERTGAYKFLMQVFYPLQHPVARKMLVERGAISPDLWDILSGVKKEDWTLE